MTSLSQPSRKNDYFHEPSVLYGDQSSLLLLGKLPKYSSKTAIMMIFMVLMLIGVAESTPEVFTNEWAVEVNGGLDSANLLAEEHGFVNTGRVFHDMDIFMFRHHSIKKRSLISNVEHHSKLISHEKVLWAEQQRIKRRVKRDLSFNPDVGPRDPLWKKTWYLLPTTSPSMRVTEAWEEGYSGSGVVVTILDDGIEYTHPDLAQNYDKLASKDINNDDDDPIPRKTLNNENRHGTRCAGEVAAVANNNYCSVGIAFNAFIGGVRMLDGKVTDAVESKSIGLRPEHIDIYSASWGPDDDGRTVDGPARLAKIAFERGVTTGRDGKGSIFVWASGNGGRKKDNCNCDGYTNSIYTLSISSTTEHKNKPWYSESCSSTLAVTYSSGATAEKQIITTDLSGQCTERHTGTSASAPLAAGICALALEANNSLTWRDMQHLVVRTANPEGLQEEDWKVNGVGRKVSHAYGYGLMDALAMVQQARKWVRTPVQRICRIKVLVPPEHRQYGATSATVTVVNTVSQCDDGSPVPDRLEHVQATLTITAKRRGDLEIYLTSPEKTVSNLLGRRAFDYSSQGFNDWPFMTTHCWDEDPHGEWTLEVVSTGSNHNSGSNHNTGNLTGYTLVLYGTLNKDWDEQNNVASQTTPKVTASTTEKNIDHIIVQTPPTGPNTTAANCKTPVTSGIECLVCEDGFVRGPDKLYCLKQCPPGYFPSTGQKDEEGVSKEPRHDDEHLYGSEICVHCAAGPYCLECHGRGMHDCTKCMDGFQVNGGECEVINKTVDDASSQSRKIYILTVLVCILSVLMFIFLFIFLHYCKNTSHCLSSKPLYKYVPNQQDLEDDFLTGLHTRNGKISKASKSHRSKKVTYTNGLVGNGHKKSIEKPFLDDSDDEGRTCIVDGNRT